MAFKIPAPIVQFPGGATLPVLPSMAFNDPAEGKRYIPVELDWPGTGATFQLDVRGLTTQPFTQIVMLDVDNSLSGSPVAFYFPDSGDVLEIPPGEGGLYPIFTGQLTMYVSAPTALLGDVTRFRILNYRQEPIGLPAPQPTTIATALAIAAAGVTPIIPPTIAGTLIGYSVSMNAFNGAGGSTAVLVALRDTAAGNAVIDQAQVGLLVNGVFNGTIMFADAMAYRFAGGMNLNVTITGGGLTQLFVNASLRYRTP